MNKKIRKIVCFIMLFLLMAVSVKIDTKAAGGLSIYASASEVSNGGTFTVTVKAASNYFVSNIGLSVSGGTVVSGLGQTSLDRGESTTAKIKLTGQTCTVSVSGQGANYDTETEEAASASVSVKQKVVVVDNRSKDNTLSSLTVSAGTLSPAFSAGTTEYSVSLDGTAEKITLSASPTHAKATVSGTGEKTLVPGDNQFAIVCTAENGAQKQYNVNIHVDETPLVFTTYNEQQLGVVRNQTEIGIPSSFEETKITMEGQEVKAYRSNQFDKTLVYMVDDAGNKSFYIYEEDQGITSIFKPVAILGRNVIIYDLTEEEQIRENMVYSEVTIDDITLYGWTYEHPDFANYIHIKVMNEFGEKVIYQYEKTENSLQLYKEYVEVEETVEEPEETKMTFFSFLEKYHLYIIAGLGVVVLALIIALICVSVKKRNKSKDEYDFSEKDLHVETVHVEPKKQPKEVEKQPEKKKRKHDARRRKAIKRLRKQRMNEK